MDWYAHSGTQGDVRDWQRLRDHLVGVAKLASEMARPFGLERAAFAAGLFHDLGKYNPGFQRRLAGANILVDHSTAGAQILKQLATGPDAAVAELIAYAILGHHAGLPDRSSDTEGCFNIRMERPVALDPFWQNELHPDVSGLVPAMMRNLPADRSERDFALSFMGRMIFSCLVDADFKDTEGFYISLGKTRADRAWTPLATLLDDFLARFDAHIARFGAADGDLNRLRSDILRHVRGGADRQPGLFTLTVPTGGGKTLASLGFALDHARRHGHRRIIYAIPFTEAWIETSTRKQCW
ncbi:MAG TPA: CRISPR-associated endonuclease Cas3'' [Pararhizobium sp.]|uniref:CRISPR-associated endonuclease Cas3'' n=1 Tax=Pararhizobium sp. TaxID=1977563 RepID=UPI002C7DFB89|nr:CRISPR-associated endonuclease Cas3'' [Pararhizobium sp.]HTO32819.1 CRISPR-associated endonuclease Cas3'' [Pararhizobium sp.]